MRSVTLGISTGHDSGVCLLQDNKVIFAINEERLTREKGFAGFPTQSLIYVLDNFREEIVNVAVDGKCVNPHGIAARYNFEGSETKIRKIVRISGYSKFLLGARFGIKLVRNVYKIIHSGKRQSLKKKISMIFLAEDRPLPTFHFVDHHTAHAFSVMPNHRFKDGSLVLTIDGVGEGVCSRVFKVENNQFHELSWQPALGSPALMYAYITKILGYRMNRHEGKITGLAAFGNSELTSKVIGKHFFYDKSKGILRAKNIAWGQGAEIALAKKLNNFSPEDIAAGVQRVCEEIVIDYFEDIVEKSNFRTPLDLYVAGGLFANVKLNQKLIQLKFVERLHVAPNMGDGGIPLGVAKAVHPEQVLHSDVYLGPTIESDQVQNSSLKLVAHGEDLVALVARKLSDGKIVAVARDRMEFGPRALGNRSILYDASNENVNKWLNKKLNRTEFMPFAPIGGAEDAPIYFKLDQSLAEYVNMTITCDVTDQCKEEARAVVHVDGTARPQLVYKETNRFIWDLLTEYKSVTGRGLLVNTSFNMHEEPIVCSGQEAVSSFLRADLDILVLGEYAYERA
jgi:carbamoyltransferase